MTEVDQRYIYCIERGRAKYRVFAVAVPNREANN